MQILSEPSESASWADRFAERGITMIEYALTRDDLREMSTAFRNAAGRRQSQLSPELLQWLRTHEGLATIVRRLAGRTAQLVRVIAFDKSPEANWFVPWHQDRTIAVEQRRDIDGYQRWTIKDGLQHVEPPRAILDAMVTLRIHLDTCDENSGPLEVLPGSHCGGPLARTAIDALAAEHAALLCLAEPGDILAMRPLIVHRSQRAKAPSRRRVLHLEYCTQTLPPGLAWALQDAHGEPH